MTNYIITNEQTGEKWKKKLKTDVRPWRYVVEELNPKFTYWIERV